MFTSSPSLTMLSSSKKIIHWKLSQILKILQKFFFMLVTLLSGIEMSLMLLASLFLYSSFLKIHILIAI